MLRVTIGEGSPGYGWNTLLRSGSDSEVLGQSLHDERISPLLGGGDQHSVAQTCRELAQELPTVAHMEQATQLVSREDKAQSDLPLGPDPEPILESIVKAEEAGIEFIYLHQIGDPMDGFIDFWKRTCEPSWANPHRPHIGGFRYGITEFPRP